MIPVPNLAVPRARIPKEDSIEPQHGLAVLLAQFDQSDCLQLRQALADLESVARVICIPTAAEVRTCLARPSESGMGSGPDMLVLDAHACEGTGLDFLRWLRGERDFDSLPILAFGFVPSHKRAIERLNAAFCPTGSNACELRQHLDDAMVRAMRMSSLIPDAAWFRRIRAVSQLQAGIHVYAGVEPLSAPEFC